MIAEQLALADADAGLLLKEAGLDRIAAGEPDFITKARRLAERMCIERGSVTTDDIRDVLDLPPGAHRNLWGAVLRPPYFQPVGLERSRRPSAHARRIIRWRLAS